MNWKQQLLAALTVIAGVCTIIGGIDLTQIKPLVPDHVAAWLVLALPVMVTIGKVAVLIGDYADDGIKNDSFKGTLLILAGLFLTLSLTSCTGIMSGVTGQPIATEPVTAKDGTVFKVATADLARTKAYPADTAWGLYNAGYVAARAAEVIESGK